MSTMAEDLNLSEASIDPTACQLALWLRLEILLPLMPLVYNDKNPGGADARQCFAFILFSKSNYMFRYTFILQIFGLKLNTNNSWGERNDVVANIKKRITG